MTKLIHFFNKISSFLRTDVWRMTEYELTKTRKLLYRLVKIVILAIRGFFIDRLNVRASALTYSILFAVVPMFALIIAIGRGFGMEDMIEQWLTNSFSAQASMIPTVMNFVRRYLQTTQGGIFIGVGIAILLYSVINFFIQVELAFNSIWKIKKTRKIANQLSMYFSAMLIIPIFILLSSGLSIYLKAFFIQSDIYQLFSPLQRFMVNLSPYVINWIIFSIMYLVIPNAKVKFKNALIAGIIAGSFFQLFQFLYINGQVYLTRYNAVYGGFAAIPLLLLWLQISCLIVLLGAEIAYAAQNFVNYEYEREAKTISHNYKRILSLFVTYIIVKQFEQRKKPYSIQNISQEYKIPINLINQIIDNLIESGILSETYNVEHKTKTYLPAFDINKLTLEIFLEKVDNYGSNDFLSNKNSLLDDFKTRVQTVLDYSAHQNYSILIKDI